MKPASKAVEMQMAPSRQRSAPLPNGINAANPTQSICIHAASEAGEPSNCNPRKKNGSDAIQFQGLPPIMKTCADRPINPCQANPQKKYTMAATANTHNAAIIECAALRERPNPVLISASPAPANGTRRIEKMQRSAVASGREGTGMGLSSFLSQLQVRVEYQRQSQQFHSNTGEHEPGARCRRRKKRDRCQRDDPSCDE